MIDKEDDMTRRRKDDGTFKRYLSHNNNFFESIDCEEKAYWLGFLAGDGYIDRNRPNLGCESADIEHMELLSETIGEPSYTTHRDRSDREGYENSKPTATVNVFDGKLVADLLKLGFIQGGNKSRDCNISLELMHEDLHRHFWRGMFDADGYLEPYSNKGKDNANGTSRIELKGSKAHVLQMEKIWRCFGSDASAAFRRYETKAKERRKVWYIVSGGNQLCKRIANWLYKDSNVYLERKYNVAKLMWEKEPVHRRFDHLGDDAIRKLILDCGSIKKAQEKLGISKTAMTNLRKRLGLEFRIRKHDVTKEQIEELYGKLGTWAKVAKELGISVNSLAGIRKRFKK
ncbi:MAG: hypothetical protein ACPHUK_05635 [Candidatus Poseidoniaceae archaeon]